MSNPQPFNNPVTSNNQRDLEGRTPIHFAVEKDDYPKARRLLSHGAHVNEVDNKVRSCLFYLPSNGIEMLKLLIQYGIDPLIYDIHGISAFEYLTVYRKMDPKINQILYDYTLLYSKLTQLGNWISSMNNVSQQQYYTQIYKMIQQYIKNIFSSENGDINKITKYIDDVFIELNNK